MLSRDRSCANARSSRLARMNECTVGPAFSSGLARHRDALHLDLRADRESVRADRRARRVWLREDALVDLVELAPLRDVREHHRALHDVAQRVAMHLERRL